MGIVFSVIKIYAGVGVIAGVSSYLYYEYPETSAFSQRPLRLLLPTVFGFLWPLMFCALCISPDLWSRDVRLWSPQIRQIIESTGLATTDEVPTID